MVQKPRHTLRHPQTFINGLEKTPEFLHALNSGTERKMAIGRAAAFHHERMSQLESPTVEALLDQFGVRVISTLPAYIQAEHELDRIEAEELHTGIKAPRHEKIPHLKAAIPFDHTLRELIDTFDDITPENIKRFTEIAMLDLGDGAEAKYAREKTREVLYGMQHELGLEQILWEVEDVTDVQHATAEQELHGIDLAVTYKGRVLFLDAKASEFGARKAMTARQTYMNAHGLTEAKYKGGYPLWTHLSDEDFGGGFRITKERAQACAPKIKATLDSLYAAKRSSA